MWDSPALSHWEDWSNSVKKKIPSVPTQLTSRLADLSKVLKTRGYKEGMIFEGFKKALAIPRTKALEKSISSQKEGLVCLAVPFNPQLPDIGKILRKRWTVSVDKHPDLKEVLPKPPIVSYRRPKSIRDILVRAQIPKISAGRPTRNQGGFKHGLAGHCTSCCHSINSKTHTAIYPNKTWPIYSKMDCNSEGVIYTISCDKAGAPGNPACRMEGQYVGLTKRKSKTRWDEHRQSLNPIIGKDMNSIGKHFNLPGHSTTNMKFSGIEKVYSKDPFILRSREKMWIKQYETVDHGLNKQT